jgi:hypothetical protein
VKKRKEAPVPTTILLSAEEHRIMRRLADRSNKNVPDVLRAALATTLDAVVRVRLHGLPPLPIGTLAANVKMTRADFEVEKLIDALIVKTTRTLKIRHGLRLLHEDTSLAGHFLGRPDPGVERLLRPMPFPRGKVTERLIERLEKPTTELDMRLRHHAILTQNGGDMVFSFAGLILDSARVIMSFEQDVAVGVMSFAERLSFDIECYEEDDPEDSPLALAQLQLPPHPGWIKNELAIARARAPRHRQITALDVMIPATGREIWAAEHGEDAAKRLPLYPEDWGTPRDRITAERVLGYLLNAQKGRYDSPLA